MVMLLRAITVSMVTAITTRSRETAPAISQCRRRVLIVMPSAPPGCPDGALDREVGELRSEPLAVLGRLDEGFHHLGVDEVAAEGEQLVEPEVESGGVRIAAQVPEVLHQD